MQLLVKCPCCDTRTSIKVPSEQASSFIQNDEKKCPKCLSDLTIHIEVTVKAKKFEPASKDRSILA